MFYRELRPNSTVTSNFCQMFRLTKNKRGVQNVFTYFNNPIGVTAIKQAKLASGLH